MSESQIPEIIVVDDEPEFVELYKNHILAGLKWPVVGFTEAREAADYIQSNPDRVIYVISDLSMVGMDGLEFREVVRGIDQSIPFALVSGHLDLELAQKALSLQMAAVIEKPVEADLVQGTISKDLEERATALAEKAVIKEIFVTESRQILEEVEQVIMDLEQTPLDQALLNEIFRLVHTIKGSSSFLGSHALPKYAHRVESLLSDLKSGAAHTTPGVITALLTAADVMRDMTNSIEAGGYGQFDVQKLISSFEETAAQKDSKSGGEHARGADERGSSHGDGAARSGRKKGDKDVIRVPITTLDEFMEISGEITIIRNVVTKLVKSLEKTYPSNRDLALVSDMLEEMYKSQSRMVGSVLDMRKIPLFDIFRPFARMVRDLCRSLGKDVKLEVHGDSVRVDTSLAKVISDSLVHIIRNSLDHGIEDPAKRRGAGKPELGTVRISCYESKDEVIIETSDDGAGMNLPVIRDKAVEKGLISKEDAKNLSDNQITHLIFEPGFSTASAITDVSGRGVGMDMVKSSVDAIGGHIDISTESGKGSKFHLRLPVPKSVMIINVILVKDRGRTFAFPQDKIDHLLQFPKSVEDRFIRSMQGSRLLVRGQDLIPLVSLGDTLRLRNSEENQESDEVSIVIVRDDHVRYAIEVEQILDSEEVVVKTLSNVLGGLTCYEGATLVGVGDVCTIINYEGLAALAGVETVSFGGPTEHQNPQEKLAAASRENDFVLFRLIANDSVYAAPCRAIYRLEHVLRESVQWTGGTPVVDYRGRIMPLVDTSAALGFSPFFTDHSVPETVRELPLLVVENGDSHIGFCVSEFVDVLFVCEEVDTLVQDRKGIQGNLTISGVNFPVIDLKDLIPEFLQPRRTGDVQELLATGNRKIESREKEVEEQDDGIFWVS